MTKGETWICVLLHKKHGRHAREQKVEYVEDRVCTIVCLTTPAGSDRDVWKIHRSKKISVTVLDSKDSTMATIYRLLPNLYI